MCLPPRMHSRRWMLGGCCALAGALLAAGPAPAQTGGAEVFRPGSAPLGKTYAQWSARWWRQAVRQTGAPGTPFAPGEVNCGAMGTRKVVFLVGTVGTSPIERSCRIPIDTAILFPVINAECSEAEDNGSTRAELRACAASLADTFTNLHAEVDGRRIKQLRRFRFVSPLFRFSSVAGNVIGIPPARRSPAVADGYWVMLMGLDAGTHTVSFGGEAPPFEFSTSTTYTLTVG